MSKKLPDELLLDSQTSLRLADGMLQELTARSLAVPRLAQLLSTGSDDEPIQGAWAVLSYVYQEIGAILGGLKSGPGIEGGNREAAELEDAANRLARVADLLEVALTSQDEPLPGPDAA